MLLTFVTIRARISDAIAPTHRSCVSWMRTETRAEQYMFEATYSLTVIQVLTRGLHLSRIRTHGFWVPQLVRMVLRAMQSCRTIREGDAAARQDTIITL